MSKRPCSRRSRVPSRFRPLRTEALEQRQLLTAGVLAATLDPHDDLWQAVDQTSAEKAHGHEPVSLDVPDHDHELVSVEAPGAVPSPIIVDFGGADPGTPVAGLDQWTANIPTGYAAIAPTGPQKIMVLRVYFKDYKDNTPISRYTTTEVEDLFDLIDDHWQTISYDNISVTAQVTDLYELPGNRSTYIDDFGDPGSVADLSNDGKYQKVLDDAVASIPDNINDDLDWENLAAVFVVMAETDPNEGHRGLATGKGQVAKGPGGALLDVATGIFSENPPETLDVQVWGRWAHELGHAFQQGGPAHPSNYKNDFELMDANMPGQTGVFEKLSGMGFSEWMPPAKYQRYTPNGSGDVGAGGGTVDILAMEYDPADQADLQAIKAEITEDLYYMVSVRRRILGDDLEPQPGAAPAGIPDEGVLIERVLVGGNAAFDDREDTTDGEPLSRWVEVKAPPGGTLKKLWQEGDKFTGDPGDGIVIEIVKKLDPDGDKYTVKVSYTGEFGAQPDVGMQPWLEPPGDTWETTDIWIDSPVNGFGDPAVDPDAFSYGVREISSGNTVPKGNGDVPAIGQTNRLYARVRNFGGLPAVNVVVHWDITDPAIAGVGPDAPWVKLGSVSKVEFPGLTNILPGEFIDVYWEWTPRFPIPEEDLEDGEFQLHKCIRVRIDPVAGDTNPDNQDGNNEQENIITFQAVPESSPDPGTDPGSAPGPAPGALTTTIQLHNDRSTPKFFHLGYYGNLPDAWEVELNNGVLGIQMAGNELREIPVSITPRGSAVLGSLFQLNIQATSQVLLTSSSDPTDQHVEFHPLGGVVIDTRVQRRPTLSIQQADRLNNGAIRVKGKFSVSGFSSLYDPDHPFRIQVSAVDSDRDFSSTIRRIFAVQSDGTFEGSIFDPSPSSPVLEIVAQFAGTVKLAGASTGYEATTPSEFYYATDYNALDLVRINADTGLVTTVGSSGISERIAGLALTNSGALYGHSAAAGEFGGNNFYKIDRLTGAATLVGSIDQIVGGAMGYNPATDTIYTTTLTGGKLVKISQSTGHGTLRGSGAPGLTSPGAAAFDTDNNRLIVFDNADDEYYAFNPSNGDATLLSTSSTSLNTAGMAYTGSRFIVNNNNSLRRVYPDSGNSSYMFTPSRLLTIGALEYVGRDSTARLLGIDFADATLYDVDRLTGAVSNPRPTGLEDTVGIAFADDHTLYTLTSSTAASNANSLFRLDRNTGAATLIGPTGLSGIVEGDLDFDPMTGILYGLYTRDLNKRQLYTIDIDTGVATQVGGVPFPGDPSAMAFNVRGSLYLLDTTGGFDNIMRVDKASGDILSQTAISRDLGGSAGMDFDPETGILFVVDGASGATDVLYSLNTSSGELTRLGRTGLADGLAGLEFVPLNGAIRGTKFNDADGDGTFDANEVGMPGWDIFLDFDQDGVVDPITTSPRPGPGGIIYDGVTMPFVLGVGGLVGPVQDLNVTLSINHPTPYTLDAYLFSPMGTRVDLFSPGQPFAGIITFDDEGFQAEGMLAAFDGEDPNGAWVLVIADTAFDNVFGALAGWSITFTHGEQVVATDANGEYSFGALKPAFYTVAEVQQPGWIQTNPWSPNSHRARVSARHVRDNIDFGNFMPGEIRGVKWHDLDGNGVRDAGEPTLSNWPIFLDDDNDGLLDPITTSTLWGGGGGIPEGALVAAMGLGVGGLNGPIVDLNVTLNVQHSAPYSLDAYLVSPAGTKIDLFSLGGVVLNGNVTFDDEALKAEGRLAGFDGEDPNGTWTLFITDLIPDGQTGGLAVWSINFTHGEEVVNTDAGGVYGFTGLKAAIYNVAEQQQTGWQVTYPVGAAVLWDESVDGDLSDLKTVPTVVDVGFDSTVVAGTVGPGAEDDVFSFVVPPGVALDSVVLLDYSSSTNTTFFGIDDQATYAARFGSINFGIGDVGTDILPAMGASRGNFTPPLTSGTYSFWLDEDQTAEPYSLQFNFSGGAGPGMHQVALQPGEIITGVDFGNRRQSQVVARHIFYNNSSFDGNDPNPNAADDFAIASDPAILLDPLRAKRALLPGETANFANYTSYSRGINGIMVDMEGLPATPTADDFEFRTGNDNFPDAWPLAPPPSSVTFRPGAGTGGSDRVTIIWPDNAIQKQWLRVKVLGSINPNLLGPDVFYFGNAIGESGNSTSDAKVNVFDMLGARDNQRNFLDPAPIDFFVDYNRDARVNAIDMLVARNNQTHFLNALRLITVPGIKGSIVDATVEQIDEQGLARALGDLDWLYEFDPANAQGRHTEKDQTVEAVTDRLWAASGI